MFKGVIFDLDETLIQSPLDYARIRRELEIPPAEPIIEYLRNLSPEIFRSRMEQLEAIEIEAAHAARAAQGVREVLERLKNKRLRTGVFTRNCRAAALAALRAAHLEFLHVVTRDDAQAKPHPEGLLKIIDGWRLAKEEVIFIGDYRHDVDCARAAGVSVAVYTGLSKDKADYGADFVFHDYRDFFRILPSLHS